MSICCFTFNYPFFVTGFQSLRIIFSFFTHQQSKKQNQSLQYYILFMNLFEKRIKSQEFSIIKHTKILETSRSQYYQEYSDDTSLQKPQVVIYEMLLSIIRKQTRKPFQLFKQFLLFSSQESSIQVNYKHARYELEIVQQNIRSACTRIRQRFLVDGFITIKNLYLKKIRIDQAYYNQENLTILHTCITTFQKFILKWEGFGKLYENFRGNKLLKLNLSKIEAISNDYTSRELDDFHPFLIDRAKQFQVIHSYIMDRSSENDVSSQIVRNNRKRTDINRIKQIDQQYIQEINNRSLKKSSTAYINLKKVEQNNQIDSNLLITHRKQVQIQQAGSTVRPSRQIIDKQFIDKQQIYLIRDYHAKKTAPSNYIKVPVLSQNLKIVQIHTKRKKNHKKRIVKQSIQIESQICQNCKYCLQMKERKEMLKIIKRVQCIVIHNQSTFTEIINK